MPLTIKVSPPEMLPPLLEGLDELPSGLDELPAGLEELLAGLEELLAGLEELLIGFDELLSTGISRPIEASPLEELLGLDELLWEELPESEELLVS